MSAAAEGFIAASRRYLADEYPRKIEAAVARLEPGDLWWRPHPACNAVGNLVLHLAGNVRQWIVHGLGGEPDVRHRQEEFDRTGGMDATAVLETLRRAVDDADRVLGGLDPATLQEERRIQGLRVSGLDAVYHVVEHVSMHTGQILFLVKMRTGADLGFYDVDDEGRVVGTHW